MLDRILVFLIQSCQFFFVSSLIVFILGFVGRIQFFQLICDSLCTNLCVAQRKPDMFILLRLLWFRFLPFVFMFLLGLHAFDFLLFLDGISQCVHQVDFHTVFIGFTLQGIFDPLIGFTAHVNKQITTGDFLEIFRSRLIAVHIYTIVQKHRKLRIFCTISQNFLRPVVSRKYSCNDL